MGLWPRLLAAFSALAGRSLENPAVPLDPWADEGGDLGPTASTGVRVGRQKALTLPAYWRGVGLISRTVAKLPLRVQRKQHPGWEDDPDHPADWLIRRSPNEAMTAFVWVQTMQHHALTR